MQDQDRVYSSATKAAHKSTNVVELINKIKSEEKKERRQIDT